MNVCSYEIIGIKAKLCLSEGMIANTLTNIPNMLNIEILPAKQSKLCTVSVFLEKFTDGQGFLQVLFTFFVKIL